MIDPGIAALSLVLAFLGGVVVGLRFVVDFK